MSRIPPNVSYIIHSFDFVCFSYALCLAVTNLYNTCRENNRFNIVFLTTHVLNYKNINIESYGSDSPFKYLDSITLEVLFMQLGGGGGVLHFSYTSET